MSKFIVIEGPDRVGKATQAELLKKYLVDSGHRVASVEVPVKSNFIYHVIYWMLSNGLAKKFPTTFQWLQYFNRQIFQWIKLPELEKNNDYIVMDRWSLSTVIYGIASGVSASFTKKLYKRLREPDCTIVLLGAAHHHEAEDVYEKDSVLQNKVRELYSDWSKLSKNSFLIDCNRSRDEVSKDIISKLKEERI